MKTKIAIVAAILVTAAFITRTVPQNCLANDNVALMLQQTPYNGGSVTPDTGIHDIGLNSEVNLTAVPAPGYHFVYWIGDVADATSNNTITYLDSPKIIIAVFERVAHGFTFKDEPAQSRPGDEMMAISQAVGGSGGSGGGGKRQSTPSFRRPNVPDGEVDPLPDPDPDPDPDPESDDFPVPGGPEVPEPATALLLALGTLFLTKKGLKKKNIEKS